MLLLKTQFPPPVTATLSCKGHRVTRPLFTGSEVLCAHKPSLLCLIQVSGALYVHPLALEVPISMRRCLLSSFPEDCVRAA